jgi:hypothetical protein
LRYHKKLRLAIKAKLVLFFLLASVHAYGQIEASANLELGYPFMTNEYNKKLLYNQLTPGLRLGVSYKPENTQFFPTLHYAFGRTKLPLQQIGKNVAYLELNYQNLMLSGNYVIHYENYSQLYIYTGIGLVSLKNKGMNVSGSEGYLVKAEIDSMANIDKRFPVVNLGFEYVVGQTMNSNIYISTGVNVQCWYFATNGNNYFLDITDATGNNYIAATSLSGYALVPYFYMSLHVMLNGELWKKN